MTCPVCGKTREGDVPVLCNSCSAKGVGILLAIIVAAIARCT